MSQYIISKSLQQDIDYIKTRTENVKKNIFEIAWKLHSIVQSPDFADSGYINIVDLAAEHFGYSRSTTLNYIAIANKYLTIDNTQDNKKLTISTTCARTDKTGKVTADYAIGQLNALGKTTSDDFITMDSEGVISPDMSADKIKQAVKEWYAPAADPAPDPEPDPEPDPDPDPDDTTEQDEQKPRTLSFTLSFTLVELVECLVKDIISDEYDYSVDCALDYALQNLTGGLYRLQINCELDEDGDKIVNTVDIIRKNSDGGTILFTYPEVIE